MATGNVKGTYDQKVKDGNTQAANKFSNPLQSVKDAGAGKSQKINQPTDDKDVS